ncbi:C39 family peptidase [Staphylococcus caledonicus]|uniref:C39 family peptidase n=1 Tax=Staphylococcus TaxID=1279 RepID=UPI001F55DE60|nr:C39 family peptidase [Staphylococcus sp. acrmy]MCI2947796.1 C39 family peptidase [Staphylococcus sp. acrmy]
MKKTILPIKPISQLFPIPMIMGCEGVSAAMLLQYNKHNIRATDIMKYWPTHPNNPYKGYVGHHFLIKLGYHQTIFPDAYVPYLKTIDEHFVDGTGTDLKDLEAVIDAGQPVIMYHTSLGRKPFHRKFKFDNGAMRLVSNIHVTLLIGYDDDYYYYIDPLWSHFFKKIILPAIVPNHFQLIKIKKEKLERSFNAPGKKCIYIQP